MTSTRPILVISGASGLIGSHLSTAARDRYELRLLTRSADKPARAGASWVAWNPEAASQGDETALSGLAEVLSGTQAIVNLAGASVAEGRLDEAHQKRILESRVQSARALLLAQRRAQNPARVWFQASATGFYGDRGDAALTERAPAGSGPLSDISRRWEAAPEDGGGARLIVGRIGIVLAKDASAGKKCCCPSGSLQVDRSAAVSSGFRGSTRTIWRAPSCF
jgi:NAD dependent epimerase/dehydratase family enzyme